MHEFHHFCHFLSVIATIDYPFFKLCTLFSNRKIFTFHVAFHFLNRQSMYDSKLYILGVVAKLQSLINLKHRILKAKCRKENLTYTNLEEADERQEISLRIISLTLASGKLGEKILEPSTESGSFQCHLGCS